MKKIYEQGTRTNTSKKTARRVGEAGSVVRGTLPIEPRKVAEGPQELIHLRDRRVTCSSLNLSRYPRTTGVAANSAKTTARSLSFTYWARTARELLHFHAFDSENLEWISLSRDEEIRCDRKPTQQNSTDWSQPNKKPTSQSQLNKKMSPALPWGMFTVSLCTESCQQKIKKHHIPTLWPFSVIDVARRFVIPIFVPLSSILIFTHFVKEALIGCMYFFFLYIFRRTWTQIKIFQSGKIQKQRSWIFFARTWSSSEGALRLLSCCIVWARLQAGVLWKLRGGIFGREESNLTRKKIQKKFDNDQKIWGLNSLFQSILLETNSTV